MWPHSGGLIKNFNNNSISHHNFGLKEATSAHSARTISTSPQTSGRIFFGGVEQHQMYSHRNLKKNQDKMIRSRKAKSGRSSPRRARKSQNKDQIVYNQKYFGMIIENYSLSKKKSENRRSLSRKSGKSKCIIFIMKKHKIFKENFF